VEVLIPDFDEGGLRAVLEAGPAVLNHNIETVRRIFPLVRAKGDFERSIDLLRRSGELDPAIPTKSGIMVGLGETADEVVETMRDLRGAGVDLLTIGQYLRPSKAHVAMDRFYHPREFSELAEAGRAMGFKHVASGPLVRSSYHAEEASQALAPASQALGPPSAAAPQ
jgi:lipoic acid synthetase